MIGVLEKVNSLSKLTTPTMEISKMAISMGLVS